MIIKGIIFDLDGTLLDSFSKRVKAWKMAFEAQGIHLDGSEIEPLIGLPGISLASKFSSDPVQTEIIEEKYFNKMLSEISFYHDVHSTIKILSNYGIKTVIVTSSRRNLVDKLDLMGMKAVTIDDVSMGKPDTESYLLAAKILQIPIDNIAVVGDSINDMIPARELGIPAILVTHGRNLNIDIYDYLISEIGDLISLLKSISSSPI
ncbi:MAG: HAD family hydrolase [Thermoplasmataceae archaeon]